MNSPSNYLSTQLRRALAASVGAALIAVITSATIGGVGMAVMPERMFGLVAGRVCPGGRLEYSEVRRSYHHPGESEPHVVCVSKNGTRKDITLRAIGSVFALIFAIAFVAVFAPVFLLSNWFQSRRSKE